MALPDGLEPCPFCGGRPTIDPYYNRSDLISIRCCCAVPASGFRPVADVVRLWNTRHLPADGPPAPGETRGVA